MRDTVPLEIPPGVSTTPTKSSTSMNWSEANLVRWVDDKLQPIGPWSKLNYGIFPSSVRSIHRWTTNSKIRIIAYLCESHLLVDINGILHDITPIGGITAPATNYTLGGFGDGLFGSSSYGTSRPLRPDTRLISDIYRLDNWGENLLAMTSSDGRLLMWNPNDGTGVPAAAVTGAPVNNRTFVVSPHRHVALFGASGVFNRVLWCDEENINNWDIASVSSKAGDYYMQPASNIVTACTAADDILLFTEDNRGYNLKYIGTPYIFSLEPFEAESCPLSSDAIIEFSNSAIWASNSGMWTFASNTTVPIECPLWDWVISNMDLQQARYCSTFMLMPEFSEIYFFFPETGKAYNTLYVMFNFRTKVWSNGRMTRSCGAKSTYTGFPLWSDGQNVFIHEFGDSYYLLPGEELPWVKSHNINAASGAIMSTIGLLKPDINADGQDLTFELEYSIERSDGVSYFSGQLPMSGGNVGFRDTGRDFRLIVRQVVNRASKWTMGDALIEVVGRGKK